MPIIESGVTDNLEDAKTGVRNGVRFLVDQQRVKIIKFGITSNPQKQLRQFELEGSRYTHMFLIFKTTLRGDLNLLREYVLATYPQFCSGEFQNEAEYSGEIPCFLYCITHLSAKM
jgi:hypothetical protein